ncbi:hypothetical protein MTX20_35005 [Bradyrhizobium sp. ISRA435]|nr:hypothetical protein MTX20_35005 [Bradyrhizobium sp. ISRA435]
MTVVGVNNSLNLNFSTSFPLIVFSELIMQGQFQVAQATGTGNSANSTPVQIYKLTKPLTDQAVIVNLGYDQKVQVDFSSIANEKITLVHIGEKLIILFDNQSTVTVEPFFDSRSDPLSNITVEMAPGRDVSGQEFATLFPITTDTSVLPAADNGGNANGNAQASGANFSPFAIDALDPVPTNQLAPQEELPNFTITLPTGFVLTQPTAPAPTISAGVVPELAVDESFLSAATNGIAGSGQPPRRIDGGIRVGAVHDRCARRTEVADLCAVD